MPSTEPESPPDKRPIPGWVLPVGLGLAAFLIRLIGIAWGLPNDLHHQSYHPDEHLLMMYASRLNLLNGQWDPHFYNYGSLWLYIMSFASPLGGDTATGHHLACRIVSAMLGSLTVTFTYLIGNRMGGFWAGLVAAILLALAPGPVVHSRFHTVDIPATFFVAAAMLLALKVYGAAGLQTRTDPPQDGKVVWYAIFGFVMAGLAGAIKYNMMLAMFPVFMAVWLSPAGRDIKARATIYGFAALLAAFIITTPGAILNSQQFGIDLRFEMNHIKEGHGLVFVNTPPAALYHLGNLVESIGWGPLLVGLTGIAAAIREKNRQAWLLLAFIIPYYAVIGGPGIEVKFLRYTLPLAPALCVFAGYLVSRGVEKTLVESRYAVVFGAVLLFSFASGNNVFVMTELMVRPDARDVVAERFTKPSHKETIGLVTVPFFYTPPFFPDTGALEDPASGYSGALARLELMQSESAIPLLYYRPPGEQGTPEWDPGLITHLKPDYVVYTSFESEDAARVGQAGYKETMKLLEAQYDPDGTYGYAGQMVHDMRYVCPQVFVWKRRH